MYRLTPRQPIIIQTNNKTNTNEQKKLNHQYHQHHQKNKNYAIMQKFHQEYSKRKTNILYKEKKTLFINPFITLSRRQNKTIGRHNPNRTQIIYPTLSLNNRRNRNIKRFFTRTNDNFNLSRRSNLNNGHYLTLPSSYSGAGKTKPHCIEEPCR